MSDHLPRTNRWLIALSVILCLILGGIFTRSSAVTSQADDISDAGAFVSEDQDSAEFTSEETLTDSNDNFTDSSSGKLFGRTSSDSSETSPGGPALSTEISPEASEGSWASSGSNWMFLVDDKPYTGWFTDTDGKQLRSSYGMVLQETWIKNGTVRDNISIGKPEATDTEIIEAAKLTHSWEFIRRLPKGLDTMLNEDSLSQGQKQLLCITRVMLCLPPMLILDEATSSIDTRTELQIQEAFERMMEGRTSFIVAHRLSTIRNADLILVMKDGSIIEQGTHDELIAKGGFYHTLYNSQFAKVSE